MLEKIREEILKINNERFPLNSKWSVTLSKKEYEELSSDIMEMTVNLPIMVDNVRLDSIISTSMDKFIDCYDPCIGYIHIEIGEKLNVEKKKD